MKHPPIIPARIEFDPDGPPQSPLFGDVYHPRAGALAQARHVFLGGNGLPQRWQRRERFVILETGFGLGNNFLATWQAWRDDPQATGRLVFLSIERHPPRRDDLARAHAGSPLQPLADELVAAWPPLTAGLHPLSFDAGRVQLVLALGDVLTTLPELRARVDAFFLDGFAPARNPEMWDPHVIKALARLAGPGATLATWSVARTVRDPLRSAGFDVERAPGLADKREMTVARFAPVFQPRGVASTMPDRAPAEATVLGAGLAGASTARALAELGVSVTVIERHPAPACEASGNVGGIFHGTVHENDGAHARWLRAGALHAARRVAPLLADGRITGRLSGLLRLETRPDALPRMQALLDRLGLPPDYVRVLDADAAREVAGVPLRHPAWSFAQGGWLAPAELTRHLLDHPGIRLQGGVAIGSLRRDGDGWVLIDRDGRSCHRTGTLVLANSAGAGALAEGLGLEPWPLESLRGQVSVLPAGGEIGRRLRVPLAGTGYALPLADGSLLCGATAQYRDRHPEPRDADHRFNLGRLEAMTSMASGVDAADCRGRVGWRVHVPDRLPIAGPLPAVPAAGATPDSRVAPSQLRRVPREPGLFALTALGGRGISWGLLLGELLAAQITGMPWPVEASLAEAADPARWRVKAARASGSAG